jgi:signal peptidase
MTVLGWCRRLASWLVVGACLGALTAGLLVPRLSGATPYTVLTGSMSPTLPPGTLAVVRPVEPAEIATGSVITYQLESGRPEVVTHRVVGVRTDLSGEVSWQTRGDANGAPDAEWVRVEQVRGEVWYAVPWLGHVGRWLTTTQRDLVVQGVALLLLAYAAGMLVASTRRRRGDRHESTPETRPETAQVPV